MSMRENITHWRSGQSPISGMG